MAEIKKIYEDAERTIPIFPQTHTKAVVDNNGNTVDSLLGVMEGVIQQKQMAVGAVAYDEYPTDDSSNWVTSDGIAKAIAARSDLEEVAEDGFFIIDYNLNIGFSVDEDGMHAKNSLDFDIIEY